MAFNPAMLSKSKVPAPGGDPMLEDEIGAEDLGAEEGLEESPFAALSDEEFIMEAEKRGMKIEAPMEEEGAEDLALEEPEDDMFA